MHWYETVSCIALVASVAAAWFTWAEKRQRLQADVRRFAQTVEDSMMMLMGCGATHETGVEQAVIVMYFRTSLPGVIRALDAVAHIRAVFGSDAASRFWHALTSLEELLAVMNTEPVTASSGEGTEAHQAENLRTRLAALAIDFYELRQMCSNSAAGRRAGLKRLPPLPEFKAAFEEGFLESARRP